MPYPISPSGQASAPRNGKKWPAFPGIPIFLETHDERTMPKTYGTTPTTPTTPEVLTHGRPAPSSPACLTARDDSSLQHSPTTTIQTSSARSSVWPLSEPVPEVQQPVDQARPALKFFPTQRPRIQLGSMPTLQIPQMPHIPQVNEKTPINFYHPGLGIMNGGEKPPSFEITPPLDEKVEDDTPNLAERIEQRLFQYSISGNIVKRWLLELISWIFSACCMAAIIGVLIYLQDDKLSNWTLDKRTGLTLNAYISVLSKMAGAALILPVSEALGQLKWSWFLQHSKQMWDFEIFDNASRGPWGAFLLLIRTKGRALAALGAMITLGLLVLDPFFQQVVDFPDRWALQTTPSKLPMAIQYEPGLIQEFREGIDLQIDDVDNKIVLEKFFYGNGTQPVPFGNGTRPDIPLSCPTSNCTWPVYDTLGVCSQCADVSEHLKYACIDSKVDWTSNINGGYGVEGGYPNATMCGYFLDFAEDSMFMMSGYIVDPNTSVAAETLLVRTLPLLSVLDKTPLYGNGSINFSHIRNPIMDAIIVSAADGMASSVYRHEPPVAQECVLSYCVKTIRSSYEWGTYKEEVLETHFNHTPGPMPWETFDVVTETQNGTYIIYNEDIRINVDRPDQKEPQTFGTANTTASNVMMLFDNAFPSFFTVKDNNSSPLLRYKTWQDGPAYTRQLELNPWLASKENITTHVQRMATAMTSVVRSAGSKQMLDGQAFNMENYVSVRWEWLTLPIGLLFMSLLFLAATIFKSAHEKEQVGVLKNSAILTLLHGIPDDMRGKLTRSASTGTPRAKAKELKVRLHPNLGWRISGNMFSPLSSRLPRSQPPPGWI